MPRTSNTLPKPPAASRKRSKDAMLSSSPASNRSLRPNRTPRKSQYFEADASGEDEAASDSVQSGYEDEDAGSVSSQSEDIDAEDSDISEQPKKKQRSRGRPSTASSAAPKRAKGEELWRSGVKTGLGPGTQVIIDKPRARSPGKTPYQQDQIHPNTMLFLRDLAENNDREWFKAHDPDYRTSWKDFTEFLECLAPKVSEADDLIPELPLKDCVFRVHRDVRFSKDPTPYKPFFSIAWSRTGRKGPYAAYYFQIKPGGHSFVGGGLWMPEAQALAKLRRNIDKNARKIKQVLNLPQTRASFLGGIAADEGKATKAFTKHNAESALRTKPRDYDANHEDIELLRLKNFTIGRKLADDEIVGKGAINRVEGLIKDLVPFVTYLNSVVMPDDAEQSSASDEEGDSQSNTSASDDDD